MIATVTLAAPAAMALTRLVPEDGLGRASEPAAEPFPVFSRVFMIAPDRAPASLAGRELLNTGSLEYFNISPPLIALAAGYYVGPESDIYRKGSGEFHYIEARLGNPRQAE